MTINEIYLADFVRFVKTRKKKEKKYKLILQKEIEI